MAIPLFTGPQDPSQLQTSLNTLIGNINANSGEADMVRYSAPIAAELVSIKAAAIAANGAITVAGQPDYPRKLQVRQVIVTAITAGTLTLVGINPSGATITEVISLVAAATQTLTTANAYAHITSGPVAGLVGGGDGTLGIGVATALGLPLPAGFAGLNVFKENVDNANEAVGTVDTVAGTVIPTTLPNATHNYDFFYSFNTGE